DLYCEALRRCGLEVIALEPDLKYPDGCFVEDTAIITEKGAIITRPGQPKRLGEEKRIKDVISRYMPVKSIEPPGTVDGGDILSLNGHFYIGLSKRTNQEGAKQLSSILSRQGYASSAIPVTQVLHLKTGVTYIGSKTLITTVEFSDKFQSFYVIEVDEAEMYAANCLLVNGFLLVPKGFPKIKQRILELGCRIIEVEMSEFRKMDGGLTCLSLLF
ncbi:N(G),N(G)-dimethylarginine dimethylaminohydrolase, partial [Candidatus Woesearchaeota archaeon]|nr:N(G),N(G)-dimethylarginine dimethylaminohydrolase [Candidatus Woesearchaeota archaeon]